jgi:hypothetical protein
MYMLVDKLNIYEALKLILGNTQAKFSLLLIMLHIISYGEMEVSDHFMQ